MKGDNMSKKTIKEVQTEINNLIGNEYLLISDYTKNTANITIKHITCNNTFESSLVNLRKTKKKCPYCNNEKFGKMNNKIFLQRVNLQYGDEFIILSEYKGIHEKVLVQHKCGYIWKITPNNLLNRKRSCPKCKGVLKKDTNAFKKEIYFLEKDNYTLLSEYTGCRKKVEILCNKCNNSWYIKPNDFLRGKRCPYCNLHKNQSSSESLIESYLLKNNIKYEREKTFDTLKDKHKLRFDFYLEDYNLVIEYDGLQHEKAGWYKNEEKLNITKKHDKMKNNWCKNNDIDILRISYKEKDIIAYLNKYLNDNYEIIEE